MKKEKFLEKFIDAIETESDVTYSTELSSLEEWDSLAAVATLALFKKELGINITADNLRNCKTIGDILDLGKESYD